MFLTEVAHSSRTTHGRDEAVKLEGNCKTGRKRLLDYIYIVIYIYICIFIEIYFMRIQASFF